MFAEALANWFVEAERERPALASRRARPFDMTVLGAVVSLKEGVDEPVLARRRGAYAPPV